MSERRHRANADEQRTSKDRSRALTPELPATGVAPTVFKTQRRIEFSDTDLAGIVHFSRFYVFMETAEHLFLNSLGTSVHLAQGAEVIGWPRLEASCRFLRPVRFEDTLDIELRVVRKGTTSLTYAVDFLHEGELVASGKIASVCCALRPGARPRPTAIPQSVADQIVESVQ